jgi:hypothetical protein
MTYGCRICGDADALPPPRDICRRCAAREITRLTRNSESWERQYKTCREAGIKLRAENEKLARKIESLEKGRIRRFSTPKYLLEDDEE